MITEHGMECACEECMAALRAATEATFEAFVDGTEDKTDEFCADCHGTGYVIVVSDDEEGTIFRPCRETCPHRRTLKEPTDA